MAEYEDEAYNNTNRAFLQAFLARSTLTYEEAKPILAAIFTAYGENYALMLPLRAIFDDHHTEKREVLAGDVTEADFNAYISAANNAISAYDFEIRSTYHQTTRTRIYALVNSTSDPITQIATTYSADEIGYLKRVLDAMFETYNTPRREVMAVTSMDAVRLNRPSATDRRETQNGSATQGSAGQGITGREAEKMLNTLVDEGWFERSRKGYYTLSPRALMELRGWLMETYNDLGVEDEDDDCPRVVKIKLCYACKEIVTVVSLVLENMAVLKLMTAFRVNGAPSAAVNAEYMIFALRICSECKSPRNVLCAKQTGRKMPLLEKERPQLRANLKEAAEDPPSQE